MSLIKAYLLHCRVCFIIVSPESSFSFWLHKRLQIVRVVWSWHAHFKSQVTQVYLVLSLLICSQRALTMALIVSLFTQVKRSWAILRSSHNFLLNIIVKYYTWSKFEELSLRFKAWYYQSILHDCSILLVRAGMLVKQLPLSLIHFLLPPQRNLWNSLRDCICLLTKSLVLSIRVSWRNLYSRSTHILVHLTF